MAGAYVVGLGAGVVILFVTWTVVLVAWVQLSREQSGLRALVTIVSILLTAVLLLTPTDDGQSGGQSGKPLHVVNPDLIKPQDAYEVYDYMFVWKGILMVVMSLNILAALGIYLKEFWSVKVHGSAPIPSQKISEEYR